MFSMVFGCVGCIWVVVVFCMILEWISAGFAAVLKLFLRLFLKVGFGVDWERPKTQRQSDWRVPAGSAGLRPGKNLVFRSCAEGTGRGTILTTRLMTHFEWVGG